MIFMTNDLNDLSLIPSSYLVLLFNDRSFDHAQISHNNIVLLDIPPDNIKSNDKKYLKEQYYKKLQNEYKLKITAILINVYMNNDPASSLVFMIDKKLINKYNFNPLKVIAKYINDTYGYELIEFTNCISRDMINYSGFSIDGHKRFEKDYKLLMGELK